MSRIGNRYIKTTILITYVIMAADVPSWTFLSNHAHVLILLAQDGDLRMRDVADQVGITERAVQRIVAELEQAGYLEITKDGRCNTYHVLRDRPLRHPVEAHRQVGDLLKMVGRRQSQ